MTKEENAFLASLREQGYKEPKLIGDDLYAAIMPFLFTHGIVVGQVGDVFGYLDRWCYRDYARAKAALDAWNGAGEPCGWHRHPASGRRLCLERGTYDHRGRLVPIGDMYVYH